MASNKGNVKMAKVWDELDERVDGMFGGGRGKVVILWKDQLEYQGGIIPATYGQNVEL